MGIDHVKFAKENSDVTQGAFWKLSSEAKFDTDIMFEHISQMFKFNGDKSSASHQPSFASVQRPTEILETVRNTQFTAESRFPSLRSWACIKLGLGKLLWNATSSSAR